jgi:hypothetical protein
MDYQQSRRDWMKLVGVAGLVYASSLAKAISLTTSKQERTTS